jgi:predicted RND superfamily exporter protein
MAQALADVDDVRGVQGLYTWVDPGIPSEMVPENVTNEFLSANYSRYIVDVDAPIESDTAMAAVQNVRNCIAQWYDDAYVTGATPVTYDIKNETAGDFSLVTILSAVFVGIILLLTFRSLTLPLILLFVIETSIWINMAIPYFSGTPMIFIGYMVVNAVQLGATIDYAILMTNYYLEGRRIYDKRAAGVYATDKAGASILMSALVLAGAGFTVALTFEQQAMAELGTLIGRGALLSGALTIIVLPQLLILFDKVIKKTTIVRKRIGRRKINET